MLEELEAHQLTVALAPAPRPRHECHCIRVVVDQNPLWYRRLYEKHPAIKRAGILSGLRNYLATGTTRLSRFDELKKEAEIYSKRTRQRSENPF